MCKLFIMTNTSKIKTLKTTTKIIYDQITAYEKDGFGYMVVGEKGTFGERTIQDAFDSRLASKRAVINSPIIEVTANTFGIPAKLTGPGVFHGRTSTNDLNILNTHPIRVDGWFLSHNGVVSNKGLAYKMNTTNDTEHLVHYMANGGIKAVEDNLSGYYAFGAIDPNGRLHMVRDSNATLYMAYSEVYESYLIATTADLLIDIAKDMKAYISHIEKVADNIYSLWEGNTIISYQDIKPMGVDKYASSYASKSLSYLQQDFKHDFKDQKYGFNEYGNAYTEAVDPSYEPSELDVVDESYCIYLGDREIDYIEFTKLDSVQKMQCVITRPDGTLIDMEDVA